jgi:hypothetical protein
MSMIGELAMQAPTVYQPNHSVCAISRTRLITRIPAELRARSERERPGSWLG